MFGFIKNLFVGLTAVISSAFGLNTPVPTIEPTPVVIEVTASPSPAATPTATPTPKPTKISTPTPQIIYVTPTPTPEKVYIYITPTPAIKTPTPIPTPNLQLKYCNEMKAEYTKIYGKYTQMTLEAMRSGNYSELTLIQVDRDLEIAPYGAYIEKYCKNY